MYWMGALNGSLALFGGLCIVLYFYVFRRDVRPFYNIVRYSLLLCLAYYPSGGTDRIEQPPSKEQEGQNAEENERKRKHFFGPD